MRHFRSCIKEIINKIDPSIEVEIRVELFNKDKAKDLIDSLI